MIDYLVEQVDIPPTILELAGIPIPSWVEGRSLVPFMRGEVLPPPTVGYLGGLVAFLILPNGNSTAGGDPEVVAFWPTTESIYLVLQTKGQLFWGQSVRRDAFIFDLKLFLMGSQIQS